MLVLSYVILYYTIFCYHHIVVYHMIRTIVPYFLPCSTKGILGFIWSLEPPVTSQDARSCPTHCRTPTRSLSVRGPFARCARRGAPAFPRGEHGSPKRRFGFLSGRQEAPEGGIVYERELVLLIFEMKEFCSTSSSLPVRRRRSSKWFGND